MSCTKHELIKIYVQSTELRFDGKVYILCLTVEGFNLGSLFGLLFEIAQLGCYFYIPVSTGWLLWIFNKTIKLALFLLLPVLKFEVSELILLPCKKEGRIEMRF